MLLPVGCFFFFFWNSKKKILLIFERENKDQREQGERQQVSIRDPNPLARYQPMRHPERLKCPYETNNSKTQNPTPKRPKSPNRTISVNGTQSKHLRGLKVQTQGVSSTFKTQKHPNPKRSPQQPPASSLPQTPTA